MDDADPVTVATFFDEFVEAFATFDGSVIARRYRSPYLAMRALYVGAVDPGDFVGPNLALGSGPGVQVFVENPVQAKLIELATARLVDDMGGRYVSSGSRRTQ